MTPRTWSTLAVLLFVGVAYCSGDANGSARAEAAQAEAVAEVQRRYADSISRLILAQDDEKRRAVDSVKRTTDTRIARVQQATDRAIETATQMRRNAALVLSLPNPTIDTLRASLQDVSAALGAVTDSLTAERAATALAIRQRDSTHEARVGALRQGFDDTRAADSAAYESFRVSVQKQLAAARPGFLRKWGERVATAYVFYKLGQASR